MKVPPVIDRVDDAYGGRVSPQLKPLLTQVYTEVQRQPTDLPAFHSALEELLTFLSSRTGRTHANCVATDSFFMNNDRWECDWGHLPGPYQDLLGLLGDTLHDTISAPEIAENFDNTPEQLLSQLQTIGRPKPSA